MDVPKFVFMSFVDLNFLKIFLPIIFQVKQISRSQSGQIQHFNGAFFTQWFIRCFEVD